MGTAPAPVCVALANQRDVLLAFAAQLDQDLEAVAQECAVPVAVVREVLQVQALPAADVRRGPREAALWRALGEHYSETEQEVPIIASVIARLGQG